MRHPHMPPSLHSNPEPIMSQSCRAMQATTTPRNHEKPRKMSQGHTEPAKLKHGSGQGARPLGTTADNKEASTLHRQNRTYHTRAHPQEKQPLGTAGQNRSRGEHDICEVRTHAPPECRLKPVPTVPGETGQSMIHTCLHRPYMHTLCISGWAV